MRDLVARPSFLLRKHLDNFLFWAFPRLWIPLYTSVTFSRMRYHQCIANKKWQDKLLTDFASLLSKTSLAFGIGLFVWLQGHVKLAERLNYIRGC